MSSQEEEEDLEDYGNGDDYTDTENIFDSAPARRANDWKARTLRRLNSHDCLVHGTKWQDRVKELLQLFKRIQSDEICKSALSGLEKMENNLCSCEGKSGGKRDIEKTFFFKAGGGEVSQSSAIRELDT